MTDLLSISHPKSSLFTEDAALAEDLRRDLGADTLFFICAVEAALGIDFHENAEVREAEENAQLAPELLEEAA